MWYHKERRQMLTAMTRDLGAWTASGDRLSWDTLCRGTEDEEVFRDSLGSWAKEEKKEDKRADEKQKEKEG